MGGGNFCRLFLLPLSPVGKGMPCVLLRRVGTVVHGLCLRLELLRNCNLMQRPGKLQPLHSFFLHKLAGFLVGIIACYSVAIFDVLYRHVKAKEISLHYYFFRI